MHRAQLVSYPLDAPCERAKIRNGSRDGPLLEMVEAHVVPPQVRHGRQGGTPPRQAAIILAQLAHQLCVRADAVAVDGASLPVGHTEGELAWKKGGGGGDGDDGWIKQWGYESASAGKRSDANWLVPL